MEREGYDRGTKWLVGHQAGAMLTIGGARGFSSWRAVQSEVVAPKRLPDGLLEVFYPGQAEPELYLLEVSTYPERRAEEQALADAMLVYLDRGRLPEVLTLVLCPRGQLRVGSDRDLASPRGWTRFRANWRVVELWELSAADLLAMNDVGLVPWIPLTRWDGKPEALLRECRGRIDRQAPVQEHDNFMAVTTMLASLRYNDDVLNNIFGGGRAMVEFPLMKKMWAQAQQRDILRVLSARFKSVAPDIEKELQGVNEPDRLDDLIDWAASCPDLPAFRTKLSI